MDNSKGNRVVDVVVIEEMIASIEPYPPDKPLVVGGVNAHQRLVLQNLIRHHARDERPVVDDAMVKRFIEGARKERCRSVGFGATDDWDVMDGYFEAGLRAALAAPEQPQEENRG